MYSSEELVSGFMAAGSGNVGLGLWNVIRECNGEGLGLAWFGLVVPRLVLAFSQESIHMEHHGRSG